jgi:hypothetical protein
MESEELKGETKEEPWKSLFHKTSTHLLGGII